MLNRLIHAVLITALLSIIAGSRTAPLARTSQPTNLQEISRRILAGLLEKPFWLNSNGFGPHAKRGNALSKPLMRSRLILKK
ncbi:MAG TPA: hypothetical protein IGS53_11425 [Leptolyngbyaceae cyanobacterium M33_DOE_097]|uniref:Uncharacterized protein n=1 Tax=Oscillatoriales cyanobacterium SpSt-418 TaxID=2282169 RepID=A0A7C3PHW9_9CYAN|nr:hypothetical protein [Leptolyngbyaceae cyanobacterium M33_DOE_097]